MPYDPSHSRQAEKLDDLLRALKAEEQQSVAYRDSELKDAQIDAWKRLFGDEYGDEVEGRSRITTREGYETVMWLIPDLVRTFTAGEKVFEFEGITKAADQHAQGATDLINHHFLRDNDGESELRSYVFDGLVQRIGVMGVEWREAEYSPAQEVTGLNSMQMQKLLADRSTRIVEQEVRQDAPDEAHPDGFYFDLKISALKRHAAPDFFAIAPEDFRVSARTVDLETTRYAGDIVRMMKGEAKAKWPDYEEEIDAHQSDMSGARTDELRAERFRDAEGWEAGTLNNEAVGDAAEIEVQREYIRHDCDGDGIAELLRCYRIGETILEYDEVDEHIYAPWTPIPIPHRLVGLSIMDETKDIQRTKTVLLRNMLDSVYFSVVPRTYANTKMVTQRGLDALLTVRPGVVIEGEGNAAEAIQPIVTPDLSQSALNAMQWMDRVGESRTGVNRSAQPMDPDLLHDTAKGVELLQNAASIRKEEIARNLALGLQRIGMKAYRLVHKHQNEARSVKIAGQWKDIDPRAWEADVRCTVSVGLGTGAREKQLMMLQMVQGDQVAWVSAYGPGTPVVTPQHLHNLVAEKLRIMGYKTPDKFFGDPVDPQTGQPFVPQPPPDPKTQEVQAKIQEGQAKLQMDAAKAQQDAQVKQFETQSKAQADVQKAQLDAQIAMLKAEAEIQLQREKMLMEMELKRAQMAFEMDMQRQQFAFEKQQSELETDAKVDAIKKTADAKANGKLNGSGGVSETKFGGEPG